MLKVRWRAVYAVLLVASIFLALSLSSTIAALAADGTAVSGRIQTTDGQPIAGVHVTLDGPAHAATTTGNGGTFTFGQLAPGTYVLRAAKAGFTQIERDDIVVAPGAPVTLNTTLAPSSFSSLQTIGRVSTNTPGKIAMNTSTAALDVIPSSEFVDQGSLQVTNVLAEQPGVSLAAVTAAGSGANRASLGAPIYPQLRGALMYETESLIDGHPVSMGSLGTFSPLLVLPGLLQSTEIAKGPGAMPVEINYAIGGTINYRTLEPTRDREFSADIGADGYGGINFTLRATGSTANKFLDYAFAYAALGTPGPLQNYSVADSQLFLALNGTAPYTVNGQQVSGVPVKVTASPFPYFIGGPGTAHFADPLYLCCSQVNTGYNARGQLGKVRLNFSEQTTLTLSYLGGQSGQDYTGTLLGSEMPLINFSTFAPPAGYTGTIPAGTSIPFDDEANAVNSIFLQSNLFQAELRSSIGATTLLGRAYSGFDRTLLNQYEPGSITQNAWGGIALCPTGTTATGTACQGPSGTVAPVTTFFNGQPVTLTTTNPAPAGTTLFLDHVRGYSLEGDRPVGAAVVSLALDTSNHDSSVFAQSPGAAAAFTLTPGSGQQFNTAMARLQTPLAAHLSMTLGTYYTSYASHFTNNGGATWNDATHAAVIPRIAFSWRPDPDVAWRFAAGGSIAPPFISLLSSLGPTPTLVTAATGQAYSINANNGQIAPEKAFGYDLGLDKRLRPALLFSSDLYFTNVNNMFLPETSQQGTLNLPTGKAAGMTLPLYVMQTGNLGNARYEGIEFQFNDAPVSGLGYKVQGSLQRAFVYGISPSFYSTASGPNTTNLGIIPNINFQGSSNNGYNGLASSGRIPYSQGYAELNYRDRRGDLALIGWTYNGPNNAYNEPAFGIFSASLRFALSSRSWLQFSGYNLTNVYGQPYDALLGGVPVGLANGKLGVIAGNNVGPTTLQVNFHETFR